MMAIPHYICIGRSHICHAHCTLSPRYQKDHCMWVRNQMKEKSTTHALLKVQAYKQPSSAPTPS